MRIKLLIAGGEKSSHVLEGDTQKDLLSQFKQILRAEGVAEKSGDMDVSESVAAGKSTTLGVES